MTRSKNNADFYGLARTTCLDTDSIAWLRESPRSPRYRTTLFNTSKSKGTNIMQLFSSTVGRKILMAITGQLMVLFVVVHLIGNSTIYFGWLNAYAHHLHALPPLVWAFRMVMLVLLGVHGCYGII